MSEAHTEPYVSGEDLRAALASRGESRPNPVAAANPDWEWTTEEHAALIELRASTVALEAQLDELRDEAATARRRERELREALRRLSAARMWQRRSLVADFAGRGLL
jgi:hypothetical protein